MAEFQRACAVDEVPEDGAIHVEIDDTPIAVVNSDGEFYAMRDVCSHEEVALSEGEVDHGTLECWLHGSRFDLATGKPTGLPATRPVPVYPVKIDGGDVYIRLNNEISEEN